jgi:hypothetical protein
MLRLAVVLFAVGAATLQAQAAPISFTSQLTNSQEPGSIVPTLITGAPRPASFGTATFVLNDAQTALSFTASIFNIDFTGSQSVDPNDNLLNAHIHAGTAATPTLPVVWGFIGNPFNDTSPTNTAVVPFATGVGGTVTGIWDLLEGNGTTLTAQLPNLLGNRAYLNFHTVQFTGGEVRGQILQVPEPGSLALLLLAGGLGGGLVRKRRC